MAKPDYVAKRLHTGGSDVTVVTQVAGVTLPPDAQVFIREHPDGGFVVRFTDEDETLDGERIRTHGRALATGALLACQIVERQLREAESQLEHRLEQRELPLQSGVLE
jgi:hypothetical protein